MVRFYGRFRMFCPSPIPNRRLRSRAKSLAPTLSWSYFSPSSSGTCKSTPDLLEPTTVLGDTPFQRAIISR